MTSEIINQLLTPLIFSVFALGFTLIWYHYRRFRSAGLFATSYGFAAIAFALEVFTPESQTLNMVAYVGDLSYLASSLFFTIAIYEQYQAKLPNWLLYGLVGILATAATWYRFVDHNVDLRVQWITLGCGALLLVGVPAVKAKMEKPVDQLVFWILTIFGLQFFLTTFLTIHMDDSVLTIENFSNSTFFAFINLIVAGLALTLAVSLFIKYGLEIISNLHGQTRTDELSGLLNRRGFEHEMLAAMARPEIPNERNALVMCDLDHFKKVNDQFGHEIGDTVITFFADLLKSNAGKNDLVGRVGGEEFCVFLPGADDAQAAEVAESLRHAFSKLTVPGIPKDYDLTASFGVAHCKGSKSETLFRRADAALYRAKQLGRNRVEADSARTTVIRKAS